VTHQTTATAVSLQPILKRLFDLTVASVLLVLLSPVLLLVAIAVRCALGSPVLFRQQRPGRNGVPFTMIKFRTMRDATDASGRPLDDADRLTPFGQLLRATSLDELPELWNVLCGHMSLVGPRPLLMEYLAKYTPTQQRRHEVRPGITGWAQVNGGMPVMMNSFPDILYVDYQSLLLDVRILLRTVRQVVAAEGVAQPGHATMPRFSGRHESIR
jgi:lipopolysaccharide/colanic/teichoic acid biosynthesis glycosyltransferase